MKAGDRIHVSLAPGLERVVEVVGEPVVDGSLTTMRVRQVSCTCGVGERHEDDHDDDCAIW